MGTTQVWWELRIIFFRELEESIIWKLNSQDILNIAISYTPQTSQICQLLVWVSPIEWPELKRKSLSYSINSLAMALSLPVPDIYWTRVTDEDWSITWKKHWKPDLVGNKWLIVPSWLNCPLELYQRNLIYLDPGNAFGTGNHATTRLCLGGLEKLDVKGKRVADLGCGSGILSLGALLSGADSVIASDTDSLAVKATYMNIITNGYSNRFRFQVGLGSIDTLIKLLGNEPADILLCNTLAPVIINIAPYLDMVLSPKGIGLLSGLLVDQVTVVTSTLYSLNWQVNLIGTKDNWALLEISK